MNYHFTDAVKGLLLEKRLTPEGFAGRLDFVRGRLKKETVPYLWNLIDSHDTARFLDQAGNDKRILKLAASLQMLLPGMPMIYYGDEVGMPGKKGSACRRGMYWDRERQDEALFAFYRRLIAIRKRYPVIGGGETEWIWNLQKEALLCWRFCDNGREQVMVLLNVGECAAEAQQYAGRRELLSEAGFEGMVPPLSCCVLEGI